ncbi:Uncharacterised protein [Mycobacteroides abscessus subsp. abscessus]|nr:Uncharacterised protein [Mycobacteroides abscessus subsp. abscessus]
MLIGIAIPTFHSTAARDALRCNDSYFIASLNARAKPVRGCRPATRRV